MLFKLSGDKYINSEAIAWIEPLQYQPKESKWKWTIRFTGQGYSLPITQHQFDELMGCLPTPAMSLRHKQSKGSTP